MTFRVMSICCCGLFLLNIFVPHSCGCGPPISPIVVCAKGIETDTHLLPLEVVIDVLPGRPLAALTGPNFAREVAAGLPTATVVASDDFGFREQVRIILGTSTFRIYGNDDPIGSQLGGAGKNVIAIAAGAVIGAGLGENARAALVTRGLSELRRLTVALGGRAETMMGLSGLGDLLLTCTGTSSRNFSLGYALGRGEHLSNVLAGRSGVTEGVPTAAALVARAGEVDLPICRAVAQLLTGAQNAGPDDSRTPIASAAGRITTLCPARSGNAERHTDGRRMDSHQSYSRVLHVTC